MNVVIDIGGGTACDRYQKVWCTFGLRAFTDLSNSSGHVLRRDVLKSEFLRY